MAAWCPDEVLGVAGLAGKVLLENGSEIYRVEETLNHVCRAFGVRQVESFATPTNLIVSLTDEEGKVHTVMRRITQRGVDLDKVQEVNRLSRELQQGATSPGEAARRLEAIQAARPYRFALTVAASGIGAAFFALIFGGGIQEFLCALAVGAAQRVVTGLLARRGLGGFLVNLVGGALVALLGWAFVYLGLAHNWWAITLAALMLLVPGLLITNALRDMATGDLVAGISRGAEAVVVAVALAAGASVVLGLLSLWGVFPP